MKSKLIIILIVIIFFIISCQTSTNSDGSNSNGGNSNSGNGTTTTIKPSNSITEFKFTSSSNTGSGIFYDRKAMISGTNISINVSDNADLIHLTADFNTNGVKVEVNNIEQISGSTVNDFTNTVSYKVTSSDNTTKIYYVKVTKLSGVIVNPVVNKLGAEASDYDVGSCFIGDASTGGNYFYGLIPVTLVSGKSDKIFVKADYKFKDAGNNIILTGYTYLYNTSCKMPYIDDNTGSFLSSSFNKGYILFINNTVETANIASIDLTLTSTSYTFTAPVGTVESNGSTYMDSINYWCQNVQRTDVNSFDIQTLTSVFIFKEDIMNREYMWNYALLYDTNNVYQNPPLMVKGKSYILRALDSMPDYSIYRLKLSGAYISWIKYTPPSPSIIEKSFQLKSELNSILFEKSISQDEKNFQIKNAIDNSILEKQKNM